MQHFEKAVFLDLASVHRGDLNLSKLDDAVAEWLWFEKISSDKISDALAGADVVVSNKIFLGAEQLQAARNLKLICIAATGTNNVDLEAAHRLGIKVCNVRAYATPSVVQHVFALLLSLTIHLNEYRHAVRQGAWHRSQHFCLFDFPIRELQGKTLGIIGYGELGKAVARLAEAFGMDVLVAKRNAEDKREDRIALDELLPQIDVLSLHCPLTDDTRGLIGKAQLALMKDDAVLINTARGGLVDEAALLDALQNKTLGAAAIDVIETEPPVAGNILVTADLPNLIVTPHIAWASIESRQRLIDEIAKNISACAAGQPGNLIG